MPSGVSESWSRCCGLQGVARDDFENMKIQLPPDDTFCEYPKSRLAGTEILDNSTRGS